MHHIIAAACNTGTWKQQLQCGAHSQNVGWDSGGHFMQGAVPLVIIALVLMVIVGLRSSRKTATN